MKRCTALTFIYLLIFPLGGVAKKLEIHKCLLTNGTISFQEKKCTVDVYKPKSKKYKNKATTKTKKKVVIHKVRKQSHKQAFKKPPTRVTHYLTSEKNALHAVVGRYHMTLGIPKEWQYFKKVYSNKLYHVKMNNQKLGLQASLMIDFVFPDNKNFSQKEIDDLVQLLGSRFVKKSKETQVNIRNFNVNNGKGALATFTSNEYMPKYRYTTKGAIFKNKWLIQFTLLSNNLQGSSHHNALYTLSQTIKITSS